MWIPQFCPLTRLHMSEERTIEEIEPLLQINKKNKGIDIQLIQSGKFTFMCTGLLSHKFHV